MSSCPGLGPTLRLDLNLVQTWAAELPRIRWQLEEKKKEEWYWYREHLTAEVMTQFKESEEAQGEEMNDLY